MGQQNDYGTVETNITKRLEQGIPHHPRSKKLMRHLANIDIRYCNDYFCWKMGGDGDNGETLMYQLDIIFELEDKGKCLL